MTRSNAREIAVQLIFSLGFGNLSAQEVLDSQLTPERFAELAEENALYAQFPRLHREQAALIASLRPVKNGGGGGVIAGIQPQDRHGHASVCGPAG